MQDRYDVIVIGGGPAGATTAALTAEAGLSTLLLEREKVPRFHVGESLMPEVYWPLQRLGLIDRMKSSSFVKKVSVSFVGHSGKESQPFYFKQHDPRESSETWQVERGDFDKMLFDRAKELGADAYDQTRVVDVLFEEDRAVGVKVRRPSDEQATEVRSKVIVDASGQQAFLANRLGIRNDDAELKKIAIWTYYKNAYREDGPHGGATVIMHTQTKESWFWYIPLQNNITSIGVVADRDYLIQGRGTPAQTFEDELVKCPTLVERLMNAELVGEFRVAKEFSYSTERHCGDGWVLVGDAFGFIDPIYSSGVYFALKSGEMAADAIVEGFAQSDLSANQLGCWCEEFKEGTQWIRKLVSAYYTNEFSFGKFLKQHPQYVSNLTDLLIGRIFYDGAGRIFDDMQPMLDQAQSTASP